MKTSSEAFDAINELERRFPVGEWCAGDVDLWPTYRFRLYGNVLGAVLLNDVSQGPARRIRQLAGRAWCALSRVPLAKLRDSSANAEPRTGTTAVFLSDGVSFVRLDNSWFDRVVDPVVLALQQRGHDSMKLTPLSEVHVPRSVPSMFVQPAIDRIKLTASGRRTRIHVPEFEAFHAAALNSLGDRAPTLNWLQLQAARLGALSGWFGRLLEQCGASYAFVNTYYSLEGLAFVQAARRLKVKTIDLQHGIQGPHHVAYARWAAAPAQGYSTLPDEFWVWGAQEAAAIDAWRASCARHVPVITGNFWLQRWRDDADPVVAHYVARAQALRKPQSGVRHVLVCLTWGVVAEETDKLIEAARLCGPSVAWWWRMHPVLARQSVEFGRRLDRCGLDGSLVGQVTDLPLYSLLRVADIAVAHSSTVVLEAAEFGVSSVVTSDYGAELHSELIRQGTVLRATDVRSIADAIVTLTKRGRRPDAVPSTECASLRSVIDSEFPAVGPQGARLQRWSA